jgi:competence protein ComEA
VRISKSARARTVGTTGTVALVVLLAACGGGGSTSTTASTATAAGGATAAGSANPQRTGPRFDPAMQAKIRQCLQAAGLPVPSFTRPSNLPSGQRPSFSSGARPSGAGRFNNPQVRAALQACGITLPTRPPGAGGAGGAGPTGAPAS